MKKSREEMAKNPPVKIYTENFGDAIWYFCPMCWKRVSKNDKECECGQKLKLE